MARKTVRRVARRPARSVSRKSVASRGRRSVGSATRSRRAAPRRLAPQTVRVVIQQAPNVVPVTSAVTMATMKQARF